MAAVLVASFVLGFFAAGLASVFWLMALAGPVALVAMLIALVQGASVLSAVGLGLGVFALAQVGFGLGLCRAARAAKNFVPD